MELVFKNNESIVTNSLLVAERFGKNHQDVLKAIRELLLKAENSFLTDNQYIKKMFDLSYYDTNLNNGTGAIKHNPFFLMNRDGFTLLTMGFTGKKALDFKLEYIEAFNKTVFFNYIFTMVEKFGLFLKKNVIMGIRN